MDTNQSITFKSNGIYQLLRMQDVERLSIKSEINTLLITAKYACDYLSEGLEILPNDFFCCVEEMKEIMESIDIKSIDFERNSVLLSRRKSQRKGRVKFRAHEKINGESKK